MSKIPKNYNLMQVPWKYVQCSELHTTQQHDPKTSMLCVNKSTLLSFQSIIQVKETKFDIIHRLIQSSIASQTEKSPNSVEPWSQSAVSSHGPGMSWAGVTGSSRILLLCSECDDCDVSPGGGSWPGADATLARRGAGQGPVVIPANRQPRRRAVLVIATVYRSHYERALPFYKYCHAHNESVKCSGG